MRMRIVIGREYRNVTLKTEESSIALISGIDSETLVHDLECDTVFGSSFSYFQYDLFAISRMEE